MQESNKYLKNASVSQTIDRKAGDRLEEVTIRQFRMYVRI